jgi:hypothetical protein
VPRTDAQVEGLLQGRSVTITEKGAPRSFFSNLLNVNFPDM